MGSLLLAACAAKESNAVTPAAALGQITQAQQQFRQLEQTWLEGSDLDRKALEPRLRAFVSAYPQDPEIRPALVWLGWLKLHAKQLDEALALAHQATEDNQPGATADAAQVLRAAIHTRSGHPERALPLLEPLSGLVVDPYERDTWAREIIEATVSLHRDDDALKWATVWRLECSEDRRPTVEREIKLILGRVSQAALERLWTQLQLAQQLPTTMLARRQGRAWMRSAVVERLARHAIHHDNSALAQRLLNDASLSLQRNVTLKRLARIAASAETERQVLGRKIGIILDLENAQDRRRSSDMVTGILQTLDSMPETERVQLITREASRRDADAYEDAALDLHNEGAAFVIGGFEPSTASQLAAQGLARSIAVVALSAIAENQRSPSTFWVNTNDADALDIWQRAVLAHDQRGLQVSDADPVCAPDAPSPFDAWRARDVRHVYLDCGSACADRLGYYAADAKYVPEMWLGPKAAASVDAWQSAQLGGLITFAPLGTVDIHSGPLETWYQRFSRRPHYYEVLGHDITVLLIAAMRDLADPAVVALPRPQVVQHLASSLLNARAPLWSSANDGFAPDGSLQLHFVSRDPEQLRSDWIRDVKERGRAH